MTTRPKALKYRTRRTMPLTSQNGESVTAEEQELPAADRAESDISAAAAPAAATIPPAALPPRGEARSVGAIGSDPESDPVNLAEALRSAAEGAGSPVAIETDGPLMAPPAGTDLIANEAAIEDIRAEGLSGRQLRMARRLAQKHGLTVVSDFDAVRQLRARGIDPFQANKLELVQAEPAGRGRPAAGRIQLPQTVRPEGSTLPATELAPARPAAPRRRNDEIMAMQRDIARRRRRKLALLCTRLFFFVMLPTLLAAYYFFAVATPMYATKSEFIIQQSQPAAAGASGLGGLFQGTSMATQQDSITVQSFLASRAAFLRLDQDHDFKAHFSQENIDPIQRLAPDATNEQAYAVYQDHVRIAYDPTEGIVKMEVIAADPETSQTFSEALIRYAEEQVDQLSLRLRGDQMQGARASYEAAEARREAALQEWLRIQGEVQQIDPIGETAALTSQISALDTQRQQLMLQLEQRLAVPRPQEAQVEENRRQIASIEALIENLRAQMTQESDSGSSLAARNTELRLAEENYTFQTIMVQQALTQMETAQIEANRQVRYLETGVEPVAPDEASYPKAFENTLLAFLIFAGIYLMLSLTASILREQVTG